MKDSLSSFLPQLPGVIDTPGVQDNSSLRGLYDKPPVCGKELHSLTPLQLSGFRLHPGPLPKQYRHKGSETPATDDQNAAGSRNDSEEREKRKEKKHKKHEKDADHERKKKKKEKKKKRSKEDKD